MFRLLYHLSVHLLRRSIPEHFTVLYFFCEIFKPDVVFQIGWISSRREAINDKKNPVGNWENSRERGTWEREVKYVLMMLSLVAFSWNSIIQTWKPPAITLKRTKTIHYTNFPQQSLEIKMADCQPQSTQFCVFPKKSIRFLAESVGISCLPNEAAGALAEDVTYRVREVVQVW